MSSYGFLRQPHFGNHSPKTGARVQEVKRGFHYRLPIRRYRRTDVEDSEGF